MALGVKVYSKIAQLHHNNSWWNCKTMNSIAVISVGVKDPRSKGKDKDPRQKDKDKDLDHKD